MVYQWREGARFPVKAQVAGEELERIASIDASGRVLPAVVVDESRPEVAPLHGIFEWNDFRAAEIHRQEQARQIIRSVYVVHETGDDGPPKPVRVYVHVHDDENEGCYMTTSRVMSDEDLRAQVLADALALLEGVRKRYEHLSELQSVFAEVERIERELAEKEAGARRKEDRAAKRRRARQPVT
jgi:hypothetical protein